MITTHKKRIAICFSGQIRTWKNALQSWAKIMSNTSYEIDIFCHTWDFNTNSAKLNDTVIEKITQFEIDELRSILKPVKLVIESEKTFNHTDKQALKNQAHLSQFYGIMCAARLKRQHEIKNHFEYDYVIRGRYDTVINTDLSNNILSLPIEKFNGFNLDWDHDLKSGKISDLFWITDSQIYDIIGDFYLNLPLISEQVFSRLNNYEPEHVFFHYLKKNSIELENYQWDIKILRPNKEVSVNEYDIWTEDSSVH